MKKLILSAIMVVGLAFTAQAQEISKNALGLRLGDNDGFGGEVTYQRGLGDNNRLELDLGWRNSNNYDAVKLAGLYQWVWNIDGGFNWYAGVGGGLANSDYNGNDNNRDGSSTYLFAAGDIGIEYNFDIPLLLSLDFRPEVYFTDDIDKDFGPDIALGIKYQF
ncbi:hypothetical protein [Flavobacterium frigidarium]|uniref:Outer membrane protein beta-barrel domain-containing protein n=1 Tax=Flavobacterium frigidarium TaxID=99286 RepID=A0ABV4KHF2_9FLAO